MRKLFAAAALLIVLPALSDLKLGGPRGLTFVAPKSLADKIMKLKFDMDLKTDGPGNPGGFTIAHATNDAAAAAAVAIARPGTVASADETRAETAAAHPSHW